MASGKTLFELTNDSCRWPHGQPGTKSISLLRRAGRGLGRRPAILRAPRAARRCRPPQDCGAGCRRGGSANHIALHRAVRRETVCLQPGEEAILSTKPVDGGRKPGRPMASTRPCRSPNALPPPPTPSCAANAPSILGAVGRFHAVAADAARTACPTAGRSFTSWHAWRRAFARCRGLPLPTRPRGYINSMPVIFTTAPISIRSSRPTSRTHGAHAQSRSHSTVAGRGRPR